MVVASVKILMDLITLSSKNPEECWSKDSALRHPYVDWKNFRRLAIHNNLHVSTRSEEFNDGLHSTRYTITGKLVKQSLMPYLIECFGDV